MWKRIIPSTLGVAALVAGLIALVPTIDLIEELRLPAVSFWFAAMGELLMLSITLAEVVMGIWFLQFARRARNDLSGSWVRPVLLGIGCFFPGLVFSLPLTVFWARHTWPGDGQSVLAALEVSFNIGIAVAIICCAMLLRKCEVRHT
jgi:hypothetical protein